MSGLICGIVILSACVTTGFRPIGASGERVDSDPKAGELRKFEIAKGVEMEFCWIPAGEAQLGSPNGEREAALKQAIDQKLVKDGIVPEALASEAEEIRGKFKTKGFWLGKFPVTQAEWKAVMGDNPSWFRLDGAGKDILKKDKIQDTAIFPVEQVTWDDCQRFLEKVNKRNEKVFGKGKFVLPHEDEWEYACRGGKGNRRAFYWGDELNGTQANCDGNYPFGTTTKGAELERPTPVGTYAAKFPHPWGLCDMHGNVWQWCENLYGQGNLRVLRGGSFCSQARFCRSAVRDALGSDGSSFFDGFRICFRQD